MAASTSYARPVQITAAHSRAAHSEAYPTGGVTMEEKGKKLAFSIVSGKVEHRGFGAGTIDLNNMTSVIIDEGQAYIDMGAMHAKSKVEKGIKFLTNKDEVPNGRKCWIVWVAVDRDEQGNKSYAGVTACEMLVDPEARRGWKILADHVNKMDYALKRRIILDGLDETEKAALKACLIENGPDTWANSPEPLKQGLA